MTPAARVAAAITVLDIILTGEAAEKALTNWARHSRFAGSKDRAAVRDHVFEGLRCLRSFSARGGAKTGRGVMIGALRTNGISPESLFTGIGYGAEPLSAPEQAAGAEPQGMAALDIPDWIAPRLQADLGQEFAAVCQCLQQRAPVFLRVNTARVTLASAQAMLTADGIATQPHPLARTALQVMDNPRKIRASRAYSDGLVELQDAGSQALVEQVPLHEGERVLDYCAGGGGKTLAMAARVPAQYFAHDTAPDRMADIPARAKRAGLDQANRTVKILTPDTLERTSRFDLVLCDAPCSGSGAWRRAPHAKWSLTEARLSDLIKIQAQILDKASQYVSSGGGLTYATCSLLSAENEDQIDAFIARSPGWTCGFSRRFSPLAEGDGFFIALLTRK